MHSRTKIAVGVLGLCLIAYTLSASTPKAGQAAPDFSLKTPSGESVQLSKVLQKGPAVLVVLRGWPGYQCPYCTAQVADLVGKQKQFAAAKATVILVYPGPSAGLMGHANDFAKGKNLPDNFEFVIDPDYQFTKLYDLRWNGPGETAYPSTFVIDSKSQVVFSVKGTDHGGRVKSTEILKALDTIK